MANKKITELPVAGTITGTEELAVVQDGVTRRSTVSGILSNNVLTSPTAISKSSTPALTITQTGSGDCLVINDANSDTSPITVTSAGMLINGHTASIPVMGGATSLPSVKSQVIGTDVNSSGSSNVMYVPASTSPVHTVYAKSRGATIGEHVALGSGESIAQLNFNASDGTGFVNTSYILAAVDGVPSTGVIPGRITIFTNNAVGTPVETIRFNSGSVGIGGAGAVNIGLYNRKTISGGTTSYGQYNIGVIQSDVTNAAYGTRTYLSTAAAAFNVPSIIQNAAGFGTLGAGSSVTTVTGYSADSTLVNAAATNTYGFRGDIAAGTGRYNFYASGTAPNYFAGDISTSGNISGNQATAAKVAFNVSDAFTSSGGVNTARYGLTYNAMGETFSVGLSGWGGLGFYTTDVLRMKIGSSGGIGIGGDPHSASSLRINGSITGGTDANGILIDGTITNTTTGVGRGILSVIGTAPATFSTNLVHFNASQGNLGAGSTVGTQYGFVASGSMIGATTNIGFYGAIPAGTDRFNFYASGTAENYFEGKTTINSTLQVNASVVEKVFTVTDGASVDLNPTNGTIQQWTLGASRSPTATTFANGQSMTLMIADGTAYAVTWPSVTWVGGSAPTLATTGWTIVELFKVGGVLYGATVGNVA